MSTFQVHPTEDFGLPTNSLDSLKSGTSAENAALYTQLLDNDLPADNPVLNFVLLNSAALLYVAKKASSLKDAVDLARQAITKGEAKSVLESFRDSVQQGVPQ